MLTQTCFVNEEGYTLCNAIYKGGKLIANPSGKWYKFKLKEKAKNPPEKSDEFNA